MSDLFRIVPYKVRSAGTDVPPEEIQTAINSLAQQTTVALNSVASDPTGPAGGDLSGTYPNPTVTGSHIASGTISGVAITSSTVDSTPVGANTPNTGAFTTATAGSLFASGGAVPGVGATGTQVYNSPNPTVQFIDSIRSANNKNAFVTWGSTVLAFGFANDAFTTFVNALTITGGQATGISGIASNSGSGSWVHTGGFSATSFTVTSAITVPNGGTGRQTLTAHGVLIGEGTAAINQTTAGATGQTLVSGGASADPAFGVAGVVGGGTGLATLTAHAVLLGEGTANVAFAAPSTAGQALISAGAAADPAFGVAGVVGGGTGLATLTAHAVLLGEGTANVAFAAPSTAGQALVSAGAAADPVFGSPTGTLLNARVLSSGTYTPTAGTNSVIFEAVGGGGGSGGNAATIAGQNAASGGGGSGAYARARFTSGFSGVTVTLGATGAAGVAGANAGGTGGTTTIGTLVSCPGGGGGGGGAAVSTPSSGGAGGAPAGIPTVTGGTTLMLNGGQGGSMGQIIGVGANVYGGAGGSNPLGFGAALNGSTSPVSGTGAGSGPSGMITLASSSAAAGAAGQVGAVIAYEYA